MWIVVWLIIDACLAILPASIAERKGKSFGVWYLYGFLIWIVAVLHAISLPEKQESTSSSSIKNSNNSTESIQINSVSSVNFVTCEDIDINAKVRIKGIEIEKDNNENVYLKLTVFNVTTDPISALNLCIEGYNSFGNPVLVNGEESFSLIVQDLYLRPKFLESIKRVMLPNSEIRKVKVNIKQICYSDGTIEELKEPKMVKSCQEPLDTQYLAYAQRTVSNLARYHMIESDEYWQCVCGEINTENVCMSCRTSKEEARKYTKENIENGYQQFLIQREEEKREGEKRAQEEEVKQQSEAVKKKKIVRLTGIGIIVSIVLVLGLISYLRTHNYDKDRESIEIALINDRFDKALKIMGESRNFEKLYDEYGDLIIPGIKNKDLEYAKSGVNWVDSESEIEYDYTNDRNGYSYIVYTEHEADEYGFYNQKVYAVDQDDNAHEIYSELCDEFLGSLQGIEDLDYNNYYLWSNDWLFMENDEGDYSSSTYHAFKYDEKTGQALDVDITGSEEEFENHHYLKMSDGNIVLTDEIEVEDISDYSNLMYFDTRKGKFKKVTYEKLKAKYGWEFEENIILDLYELEDSWY